MDQQVAVVLAANDHVRSAVHRHAEHALFRGHLFFPLRELQSAGCQAQTSHPLPLQQCWGLPPASILHMF